MFVVMTFGCRHAADIARDGQEAIESRPYTQKAMTPTGSTLFAELPADRTGLDFQMELYEPVENIRELMFITANGGICTGDYDDDGLADIYVTSPVGGNRLYRNLGGLRFQDVTQSCGLENKSFWGTGATFVDIDNDGDLDIYACGYRMPNQLWINDAGRFTDQAAAYGLDYDGASMTMAFADIDNDGDLDGYLATTALSPPKGTKFRVRFEKDGDVEKPVVLEELREYWELIYLPGGRAHRTEAGQFDHLFRNDGGRFVDITNESGIDGPHFTLSATCWDYNRDGYPDIYVSNDFLGPDKLYHNNGDGTFVDVIDQVVGHTPWFSMGSDLGDVNNDGLIDFFASDMSASTHYRDKVMMGNMDDNGWFLDFAQPRQYMRNAVYLNAGVGPLMEVAFQTGLASSDWTWTPRLADFDNDGRVDVFATNGILRDSMNSDVSAMATEKFRDGSREWAEFWAAQPMYKEPNQAFRNMGDLRFQKVGVDWGLDRKGVSFGAATADFDNDGDLDIVVNNADTKMSFYENQSTAGSSLLVRLRGEGSNRFGVGATVKVIAGGQTHVRYLTLARGWLSSCEPVLHFGIGDATKVDQLVVSWPSGHEQSFRDLEANQHYTIHEPIGSAPFRAASAPRTTVPDDALLSAHETDATHVENAFDDFALQPLLPNRQSQMGPALALGDIDGDGDVDGFLGGASGQAGQLLMNEDSTFVPRSISLLRSEAEAEDIDAEFLDVDNDWDLDLFVVRGSNEWKPQSPQYRDRLFLNNGRGGFSLSEDMPEYRDSGGCVAVGDIDADGDVDVFVGGRAIPGAYPTAAQSRLLLNDGGTFVAASTGTFDNVGIVTGAQFVDVNADDSLDLVLSTEWGPVRVFINDGGKLTEKTDAFGLNEYLGWWNSIDAGDVDGDGDVDLIVTNFGKNTKYKATQSKSELLYFGDLDGTGKPHIVEAKFEGDRCLPRRGFSCSQNAMPFLKPKLKTFHNFAMSSLDELYTSQRLAKCKRYEVNTLESGVLMNSDGRFEFRPLPAIAQIAPSFGAVLADIDQDGILDVVMAQNFSSPQRETGRMDGGLSLLLKGDGAGQFEAVWPRESGIALSQDTRCVACADLNGDGKDDVVFAANNGPVTVLLNSAN